jgi:hypothetical protein
MVENPSCISLCRPPILTCTPLNLIAHVAANVAFFFDEACKLLELGFLFCHAGHQYTKRSGLGMRRHFFRKSAPLSEKLIAGWGWPQLARGS